MFCSLIMCGTIACTVSYRCWSTFSNSQGFETCKVWDEPCKISYKILFKNLIISEKFLLQFRKVFSEKKIEKFQKLFSLYTENCSSAAIQYTWRNIFRILLTMVLRRLVSVITIQLWFDLTRFMKIFLCVLRNSGLNM